MHVYRIVTEGGARCSIVLSGIGADAIFRGHVPTPNGLSYDLKRCFSTGKKSIDDDFWKRAVGGRFDALRAHADEKLDWMQEMDGEFGSVESYFAYEIYEGLPRYFNGELSIADHFTSLRIPFIDPVIIRLACDIEYSLFTLWRFINEDKYRESYLQTSLIATNPKLVRVKLQGLPPRAYTSGNRALHDRYRLLYKGPSKLLSLMRHAPKPGLENWVVWSETAIKGDLDRHLSADSLVSRYVTPRIIEEMRAEKNLRWIKIIATLDMVLEYDANGWKSPPW